MTRIYIGMENEIAIVQSQQDQWQLDERFTGTLPECVAVDPYGPERVYCGTSNKGLWYSNDAGLTWSAVGQGIPHEMVMSVAVSASERVGEYGVVWAGTEPSALYRSEDGGATWQERTSLQDIPSKSTWSFPPKPYTHHIRWIQPDPIEPERIFVAIERGGVMRSLDKGLTWEDHNPAAQIDGHALSMHAQAPGRLYETAGGVDPAFRPRLQVALPPFQPRVIMRAGGYAETTDGGATWKTIVDGLDANHYLWSVAVDAGNPDTIVASAAVGPIQAHRKGFAESYILRRTGGGAWQRISAGLPSPKGTIISSLVAAEPGVFYAANNRGVFRSQDAGQSWQALAIAWPERYQTQHVKGMAL
ncbi:MAG TPA: glycosyl hydrolase [Ktedonobacteraceae bacterium]|nr:glycosyl hydrolase [Ktedonobacteraceae bacterium]